MVNDQSDSLQQNTTWFLHRHFGTIETNLNGRALYPSNHAFCAGCICIWHKIWLDSVKASLEARGANDDNDSGGGRPIFGGGSGGLQAGAALFPCKLRPCRISDLSLTLPLYHFHLTFLCPRVQHKCKICEYKVKEWWVLRFWLNAVIELLMREE